jgi:hypothetical protein
VNVVDVDTGCEDSYDHIPDAGLRDGDFGHLNDFGKSAGPRPPSYYECAHIVSEQIQEQIGNRTS